VLTALVVAPLQIWLGDGSGRSVFTHQPAKGAALEGLWDTNKPGKGAPWSLLAWPDKETQTNDWSISIPNGLSLLATHSLEGKVTGLKAYPQADQPPALPLIFYAFRLMVAIGLWFFLLTGWSLWAWRRGKLTTEQVFKNRWLLRAWVATAPLGYLAVESGWVVREVGRQPWVIYGLLRTHDAASRLPAATVEVSLVMYALIYTSLLTAFLVFALRLLRRGPALAPPIQGGTTMHVGATK
jgi:cytochrome d ubiquinol oxidase subunit I